MGRFHTDIISVPWSVCIFLVRGLLSCGRGMGEMPTCASLLCRNPTQLLSLPPGCVLRSPRLLSPLAQSSTRWNEGWACPEGFPNQGGHGKRRTGSARLGDSSCVGLVGTQSRGRGQTCRSPSNRGSFGTVCTVFFYLRTETQGTELAQAWSVQAACARGSALFVFSVR